MKGNFHSIVLLRGLPGSGKSSLARLLSENGKHPVFSVDDFFTDELGNYKFDHLKNHLAYDLCRNNTEQAMIKSTEKIFVDNTFTLDWEMEPYFKLASEHNYRIYVVTVENYHGEKNIHGITEEQVEKMRSKYRFKL